METLLYERTFEVTKIGLYSSRVREIWILDLKLRYLDLFDM